MFQGVDGKWEVKSVKQVYDHERARVSIAEIELPDGTQIEHHFVTVPKHPNGGVALLAHVEGRGVLMIWRHRFITDDWTWEIPGGAIDGHESPAKAAAREMFEETGWRPGKVKKLVSFQGVNGVIDHPTHCFITHEATYSGPGRDTNEASDIAWVSIDEIKKIIECGDMRDGTTLTAVLYALTFARIG